MKEKEALNFEAKTQSLMKELSSGRVELLKARNELNEAKNMLKNQLVEKKEQFKELEREIEALKGKKINKFRIEKNLRLFFYEKN